ncbi:MAG: PaaI family thioesterase [Halobacteriales archaeon]|nr:PaaI family thioesterase [Halobacteriales archaeon]
MDVLDRFNDRHPFNDHFGVEVTAAADGHAEGRLELADHHSLSETMRLAHGGVAFSLADTLSAAALASVEGNPGPTIDVRIDYLRPATGDLEGSAEVVRYGDDTGVVEAEITQDGAPVATTQGVYKTNLVEGQNPFVD